MRYYVRARSRIQVETCISYPLDHGQPLATGLLEAYLFVPKSLGINLGTYPKYLFYRDLQTYAELVLASEDLTKLSAGDDHLNGLWASVEALGKGQNTPDPDEFETHFRLFCTAAAQSFKEHLNLIRRQADPEDLRRLSQVVIKSMRQVTKGCRALNARLKEAQVGGEFRSPAALCDEYISLLAEELSLELLAFLDQKKHLRVSALREDLLALAQAQTKYRLSRGYDSVPCAKLHHEALIHRRGVLSRYMKSVLFLSTRHKPEGRLFRELAMSVAAGAAMVFATAAAFLAHVRFENWTTTFFVVLVISYMFKDRIKALAQTYLQGTSQRLFYDYKTKVYGEKIKRAIGFQREQMNFIRGDEIDPKVMTARAQERLDAVDTDYSGETILFYKRRTGIFANRFTKVFRGYPIEGLQEVIHFDLTRFVRKMENPKQSLFVTDGKGYTEARGQRVYFLNLVIKFRLAGRSEYHRYRFVMTRNGIRRIERVS